MENVEITSRKPCDLSSLIFQVGNVGELTTLKCVPVIGGDSYQDELVGSFRLSPMHRFITLDATIEVMTFYVPHRHCYQDDATSGDIFSNPWIEFIETGASTPDSPNILTGRTTVQGRMRNILALSTSVKDGEEGDSMDVAHWRYRGYWRIYNNYFKRPDEPDESLETSPGRLCHLKNMWTASLGNPDPSDPTFSNPYENENYALEGGAVNLFHINEQDARLHIEQINTHWTQRFRDKVDRLGGTTTADVDMRPTLVAHTKTYSSGYDVDGTSSDTLGQYVGRVTCPVQHRVPRFYCNEHGAMWTVMCVRFPPICANENHYLDTREPSYEDLVADPDLLGNMRPLTITSKDIFSGDTTGVTDYPFMVTYGQWLREHPSFVSVYLSGTEGFPFMANPTSRNNSIYVRSEDYDIVFQGTQFLHWQFYGKSNAMALRRISSIRTSLLANP